MSTDDDQKYPLFEDIHAAAGAGSAIQPVREESTVYAVERGLRRTADGAEEEYQRVEFYPR